MVSGSSEPSLLVILISTQISCGDSFAHLIYSSHIITALLFVTDYDFNL